MSHLCEYCGRNFTRRYNLNRHSEKHHGGTPWKHHCTVCKRHFSDRDSYNSHISQHLKSKRWSIYKSAFSGTVKVYRKASKTTSFLALSLMKPHIVKLVKKELILYPKFKMNLSVVADYQLDSENMTRPQIEQFNLKSKTYIVSLHNEKELNYHIDACLNDIRVREDQLNLKESGWSLKTIWFLDVQLTQINILL